MSVKNWLDENKIYFETVAAVFVGVASAVLTYASVTVARKANAIATVQVEMAKAENQPILTFDVAMLYDSTRAAYAYKQLSISNTGAALSEFRSDVIAFFEVEVPSDSSTGWVTTLVPVWDYYDTSFNTQNRVGLLVTLTNYTVHSGNHYSAVDLERDFRELMNSRGQRGSAELQLYARVRYRDIYNEEHTKYFELEGSAGTAQIQPDTGKQLFDQWDRIPSDITVKLASDSAIDLFQKTNLIISSLKSRN